MGVVGVGLLMLGIWGVQRRDWLFILLSEGEKFGRGGGGNINSLNAHLILSLLLNETIKSMNE